MDIDDLLAKSIVMLQVESTSSTYKELMISDDVSYLPGSGESTNIIVPFTLDTHAYGSANGQRLIGLEITFAGVVNQENYTPYASSASIYLRTSGTQDKETVDVLTTHYAGSAALVNSTPVASLDPGVAYALLVKLYESAGKLYIDSYVVEAGEDGYSTYVGGVCSTEVQGTYYISYTEVALWTFTPSSDISFRVMEPMIAKVRMNAPPLFPTYITREFAILPRKLAYVYYSDTFYETWVIPPAPILESTSYDQSAIYEARISDLEDDLSTAQTDLTALTTRISNARAGYLENINNTNLSTIPSLANIFGTDYLGKVKDNIPDLTNIFSTDYLGKIKDNVPDLTNIFSSDYLGKIKDNIPDLTNIFSSDYLGKIKDSIPDLTDIFSADYLGKIKNTLPDLSVVFNGAALKDAVVDALFGQVMDIINEVEITREAS